MAQTERVVGDEKCLEVLHDYFKETFARVVQMERVRDRQFFWVILLFALLTVEIGYPAAFQDSVGGVGAFGVDADLRALPLPALLNATWVLTLAVALSYCRTSIWVSRNYKYVHKLEATISPMLNAGDMYLRESKYYEDNYPTLLNMAWISYVFVFPIVLYFAVVGLIYCEMTRLAYPLANQIVDGVASFTIVLVIFFYQVQPYIAEKWSDCKTGREEAAKPFVE